MLENYSTFGNEYCANVLKRSIRAIEERRKILKIKTNNEFKQKKEKYNKELLEEAVKNSFCYADVIRFFNLTPQSGNFSQFKRLIKKNNIDVSHFLSPGELTKLRLNNGNHNFEKKDLKYYLVDNKIVDSKNLKKRLYEEGLKKPICEICQQDENWHNNTKLIMILDHINGNHFDNRIENLRIVCPNCNSTLETNCSKNRKIKTRKFDLKDANFNNSLIKIPTEYVVKEIPSKEELLEKCKKMTYKQVGLFYGVSDNMIIRWIKSYGLDSPRSRNIIKLPSLETLLEEISNMSYESVGKKYGISANGLKKRIKKLGSIPPKKNKNFVKWIKNEKKFCEDCKKQIRADHKRCGECYKKYNTKFKSPPLEELIKHVDKSCREIGKLYNVSPNTVSRWFKNNNIKK